MKAITPHLWFDKEAKQAAAFYVSLFPRSRVNSVTTLRNTPSGDSDLVAFTLAEQPFVAISAGPRFRFNSSISFAVRCRNAAEVDELWSRLLPGGRAFLPIGSYPFSERYGWLEDRYGLSWQLMYAGDGAEGQKITPVLLFTGAAAGKAEEAIQFYAGTFPRSRAAVLARYGADEAPEALGTVKFASFTLAGQQFAAMDSARPHGFAFNEAISFLVPCDTQAEIDEFWVRLSADPRAEQCGWLKDRFGVSWQIAPAMMGELMGSGDEAKTARVTRAFLQMKKLDIAELRRAAAGAVETSRE